jgi:YidC/Oxa1 family membrane protein insertase
VDKLYEKHPKACLVTTEESDPSTGAILEKKTWGDAWKTGLLEGLIVYPIAWLLSSLTNAFGGGGVSQLFAILITVVIIRAAMLVMNFKGQISTIKMQSVQGEMSKISSKLRDPNLSQQERQALSMKMMEIYKKNDIHPFSTFITTFISFPIFIAVWAAMNQTVAIRRGTLLGLNFGEAVNSQIFSGNIAAIVLFLLMISGQIVSMKLSAWIKIYKEKKKNPNYQKPSKGETEKNMNIMMTVMIVMITMSGFLLPAALVIYWFLGSVFTILQTLVFSTDFVNKKLNNVANRKKKAKVIR